jgi:hypothetical protein
LAFAVATLVCLSCFGSSGCEQGETGAVLDVYLDEGLDRSAIALCWRVLSRPGTTFEQVDDNRVRLLLQPTTTSLDYRLELVASRRGDGCVDREAWLVRRVVARRYVRNRVTRSLPDIVLVDPCRDRCADPFTCVPCFEWTRVSREPPRACSESSEVCVLPENAPTFEVPFDTDTGSSEQDVGLLDAGAIDVPDADSGDPATPFDSGHPDAQVSDDAATPFDSGHPDAQVSDDAATPFDSGHPDAQVSDDAATPFDSGHPDAQASGDAYVSPDAGFECEITTCLGGRCMTEASADGTDCFPGTTTLRTCLLGMCTDGCHGCTDATSSRFDFGCLPEGERSGDSCALCRPGGGLVPLVGGTICRTLLGVPSTCDGVSFVCPPPSAS